MEDVTRMLHVPIQKVRDRALAMTDIPVTERPVPMTMNAILPNQLMIVTQMPDAPTVLVPSHVLATTVMTATELFV
jgi:hypothetical protein